ncbi:MAG: TetM/TetW/TetO/TetS family tetracycline resistance ribosomal protection protein, partial [Lachnospiraceae bacterium]|nr:TetM/TetW/TetO/TetS family tetracycline resistance ribosomal protection protein [Lachnospiraceae bacterium]
MDSTKSASVIGILAHVDAGKTTLAEALLFVSGTRRTQGRVDHGDTVMDSHELERERGITIFSSEAVIEAGGRRLVLLDTPGHVDFSAETERTLRVLDAAILVLSGTDGVQAHTRTLWRLLSLYRIPVFIFVTKMDYARHTEEELLNNLSEELSDSVVRFGAGQAGRDEQAAMQSEEALQEFLDTGRLSDATLIRMIASRQIFPVWFGSGLRLTGVPEFLQGLARYVPEKAWPRFFGARVFKISSDEDGSRLTHLRVTGGTLRVRDSLTENEKVSQLRIYTGEKYTPVEEVPAGMICVAAGLRNIPGGAGLGYEGSGTEPVLSPVMRYSIVLPEDIDAQEALADLRRLEAEDPLLEISWDPWLKEIRVALMGEVQAEILKSIVRERFGFDIDITRGHVLYRETILNKVEGVGHYEPLRHYAEVHLLLEPAPRGSGLVFASNVSTNALDRNWQNLILQHLSEKEHVGVLTGSPLTDVKITLQAGRAHLKHTEGGDFRQATYRAVRQGLMHAKSALLEPWYRFRIEVPTNLLSRAMTDIKAKSGSFLPPVYAGDSGVLTGRAPCIEMSRYAKTLASYSGGLGRLFLEYDGYDRCHNEAEVLAGIRYDPEADTENTPDSVFCAHGAGFLVKWRDVPRYMHLPSCLKDDPSSPAALRHVRIREHVPEDELEAIMLREFGPIRRPQYRDARV